MTVIKIINTTNCQNSYLTKPDLKTRASGKEEFVDTTHFNQLNNLVETVKQASDKAAFESVERIKQLIYENKYPINLEKIADQLLAEDLLSAELV